MNAGTAPGWLEPQWPVPRRVRALSTLRGGGSSPAPYASLNLGAHVGDATDIVQINRAVLRAAAALPAEPRWMSQVHGIRVLDIAAIPVGPAPSPPEADAAVARAPGQICAVLTADCLPVLFAARDGSVVGAAHAGWRGLAAGVLEATIAALRVPAANVIAWLGPAIGPAHFEVGSEVRDAFVAGDPGAGVAFAANSRGRYMADLAELARRRLASAGVSAVFGGGECTYSEPQRFFSHRRDAPTGRQASLIWLE